MRQPYRFFIHPTPAVETIVHQHGLTRQFYRRTFLWQMAVYVR
jgi:hypothetical protein